MKKIIDNKVYDTEKATEKATWEHHTSDSPYYCKDTIYLTAKGNWFIHFINASSVDGVVEGFVEDIRMLSSDMAYEWLRERHKADLILEHFPEMVEEA